MSKCDVNIVFDRSNRTFRAGEEVTGTVHVQVNRDVKCDGVLLENFWRTHGRGNKASGAKTTLTLHRGALQAGESLAFPFSFVAPHGPPTYHGHYLNVDHYLKARVDIPWAIDPKREEEYVLLPGTLPWGNLPKTIPGGGEAMKGFLKAGVPIGVGLVILGFFLLCPFGIVLIPAGLILIFCALRKSMAEKKIGSVKVNFGPLQVPPGAEIPLQLDFTPRQTSKLNRIIAKLSAEERCVSGGGTKKTTHTHKLHERITQIMPQGNVTAGRAIQLKAVVSIPDGGAFSFHADDNDLLWRLEVRIDIPLWPDWVETRPVTVRPAADAAILDATAIETEPVVAPLQPGRSASPFADRMEADIGGQAPLVGSAADESYAAAVGKPAVAQTPHVVQTPAVQEPSNLEDTGSRIPPVAGPKPTMAAQTGDALVAIVTGLLSAEKYGPRREQIIKANDRKALPCVLQIEKVERTYSYSSDERFRDGRTVTGIISGTECEARLQLPEQRNDEADALEPGATLTADCLLLKWDNIYDRLELRQV